MLYRSLFRLVKRIIPRISETELIALRSGTTCIDTDIFKGKVDTSSFKPKTIKRKFKNHDLLIISTYYYVDYILRHRLLLLLLYLHQFCWS